MKRLAPALFTLLALPAQARIGVIFSETEVIELPRSQIKTYLQSGTLEASLREVKAVKPSALQDEELASIPERYLPPELVEKQRAIKARIEAREKEKARAKASLASKDGAKKGPGGGLKKIVSVGTFKMRHPSQKGKHIDVKIDEAVWVPPTAAVDAAIMQPQRKLPDVELLELKTQKTSGAVAKEIHPGDTREVTELFKDGKTSDKDKLALLPAFKAYDEHDYATAVTLALAQLAAARNEDQRVYARWLAAHALYQAGFFASALPHLVEVAGSKLRRSAIGMAAHAIGRTHDDGSAYQILSKVSLSQITEEYRPLFSYHLGRVLLETGAQEAALAAFERVGNEHERYAEAQYYIGVIKAADIGTKVSEKDWANESSEVFEARNHFEQALVAARAHAQNDLLELINLSLARLAYQARQYHQAVFHYNEVPSTSPFAREAVFETGWSLYRMGEFNRSLGVLHPLGSPFLEARDLPELWILRSLNYLKLCRFDEANRSANTFDHGLKSLSGDFARASGTFAKYAPAAPSELRTAALPDWLRSVLLADAVVQKDLLREELLQKERARLGVLSQNLRVASAEVRGAAQQTLERQIDKKIKAVASALKPYLANRVQEIEGEYKGQRERLDFLRFEIYSQAARYPASLARDEAKKMLAKSEFMPGVFLKGHEILWRFSDEYWLDEIRGYDYFVPSECKTQEKAELTAAN